MVPTRQRSGTLRGPPLAERVVLDCPQNAIELSPGTWVAPMRRLDPKLAQLLEGHAESRLVQDQADDEVDIHADRLERRRALACHLLAIHGAGWNVQWVAPTGLPCVGKPGGSPESGGPPSWWAHMYW